jgi:cAMP phosphodiesterase
MQQIGCKKVVGNLEEYLDGTMEPELKAQIDAHLKVCPYCSRIMKGYQKTITLLKKANEVEPDMTKMERLREYIITHLHLQK